MIDSRPSRSVSGCSNRLSKGLSQGVLRDLRRAKDPEHIAWKAQK